MIPKRFQQFGSTIKVVHRSQDNFETNCTYGHWIHADREITIRSGLHKDIEEQTFWHEFFHSALDALNYSRESSDERLVDGLAGLTLQMLKTSKR